jgi:hypothetical protein
VLWDESSGVIGTTQVRQLRDKVHTYALGRRRFDEPDREESIGKCDGCLRRLREAVVSTRRRRSAPAASSPEHRRRCYDRDATCVDLVRRSECALSLWICALHITAPTWRWRQGRHYSDSHGGVVRCRNGTRLRRGLLDRCQVALAALYATRNGLPLAGLRCVVARGEYRSGAARPVSPRFERSDEVRIAEQLAYRGGTSASFVVAADSCSSEEPTFYVTVE